MLSPMLPAVIDRLTPGNDPDFSPEASGARIVRGYANWKREVLQNQPDQSQKIQFQKLENHLLEPPQVNAFYPDNKDLRIARFWIDPDWGFICFPDERWGPVKSWWRRKMWINNIWADF